MDLTTTKQITTITVVTVATNHVEVFDKDLSYPISLFLSFFESALIAKIFYSTPEKEKTDTHKGSDEE
jgi:hypothetical protein